jgi:hypothetical protein
LLVREIKRFSRALPGGLGDFAETSCHAPSGECVAMPDLAGSHTDSAVMRRRLSKCLHGLTLVRWGMGVTPFCRS